jgi:hypothetical protein
VENGKWNLGVGRMKMLDARIKIKVENGILNSVHA